LAQALRALEQLAENLGLPDGLESREALVQQSEAHNLQSQS